MRTDLSHDGETYRLEQPKIRFHVGVDGPYGIECARLRCFDNAAKGAVRMTIIRIGLDTSKHVFQVHGVDESEQAVLRRQLRRGEMTKFFAKLAPTRIGIEACGASHHWARVLRGLGHEAVLLPPQYVRPYVKRGKNDAIDAAAICEAMSRPSMRFVPVKTAARQAALTMLGVRDLLVKQRTMLINAIRGHAAEFGVTAAKSLPRAKAGGPSMSPSCSSAWPPRTACRSWPARCWVCWRARSRP